MFEKIKAWLKEYWFQATHDPNSPEGLKHRAERLVKKGVSRDNPAVSSLVKQALLKEHKSDEIPDPNVWEHMTVDERKRWVEKQLQEAKK